MLVFIRGESIAPNYAMGYVHVEKPPSAQRMPTEHAGGYGQTLMPQGAKPTSAYRMPPAHAKGLPPLFGIFGTIPPDAMMQSFGVLVELAHAHMSYIFGVPRPCGCRACQACRDMRMPVHAHAQAW
jgi:hypothetical protein